MVTATKLRHAGESGYSRGEETRTRIVNAALKLFGERGFDAASTRDIAAAAGVNAPALQYYFDNKEGVYRACTEYLVQRLRDAMADVIAHANAVLDAPYDHVALIDAFCAIQMQITSLMLLSNPIEARLFMAREQVGLGPDLGPDTVGERMRKPIFDVTCAIVGRLTGKPADDDETIIRTTALNGQLVLFQVIGRRSMRDLPLNDVDPERLLLIKKTLTSHTKAILLALLADR